MEELRSTEILDLEIENDAKKKAEKILASAEEEKSRIFSEVEIKVKEAKERQESFYKEKLAHFENYLKASVPLEKKRFLIDFYFSSVSKSLNDYLKSLSNDKILQLLSVKLKKCISSFEDKKFDCLYFALEGSAVEKSIKAVIKDNLISVKEIAFAVSGEEAFAGNDIHSGYILISSDSTVKIRVTVDQIIREIREKYNYELTTSLFNGGLPE